MHRQAASRAGPGAIALLTVWCAGCAFVRLKEDVEEIKHTAFVTGAISGATDPKATIYLFHLATARDAQVQAVHPAFPEYGLLMEPGLVNDLIAFQDLDGDRRFSAGEPIAVLHGLGGAKPLARSTLVLPDMKLSTGQLPAGIELPLPDPSVAPAYELGTVRSLDDAAFAPERAALGMWQPLTALKEGGYGVFFLEPYDPNRVPVVFVHGINGTPRDLAPLIQQLDRTRYQPWVVYYPSGIRLPLLGQLLGGALFELEQRTGARRLVLIAHSMGGLVSRAAVFELERRGRAGTVRPFITLSTPWGGHAAAASGLEHAPQAVPAWVDLAPGSAFLAQLARPLPKEVPFYLFFGVSGRAAMVGDNNDGVVSVESELAPYAQEQAARIFGFPETHMTILGAKAVQEKLWPLLEQP